MILIVRTLNNTVSNGYRKIIRTATHMDMRGIMVEGIDVNHQALNYAN